MSNFSIGNEVLNEPLAALQARYESSMSWPMIEVRIPDNASLSRALLHVNIDINRNIFCTHSSPSSSSLHNCSTEERSRSCLCLRLAAKVSIEPL